jgi:hypothetical protein
MHDVSMMKNRSLLQHVIVTDYQGLNHNKINKAKYNHKFAVNMHA